MFTFLKTSFSLIYLRCLSHRDKNVQTRSKIFTIFTCTQTQEFRGTYFTIILQNVASCIFCFVVCLIVLFFLLMFLWFTMTCLAVVNRSSKACQFTHCCFVQFVVQILLFKLHGIFLMKSTSPIWVTNLSSRHINVKPSLQYVITKQLSTCFTVTVDNL